MDDVVTDYRGPGVYLAKIDIGAFGERAFAVSERGSVAMLAGEPLLAATASRGGRSADLKRLQESWDDGRWDAQCDARGVFCAVHYDPAGPALTIVGDKLGVRPVYFWSSGHYVIFATALRILEALPEVPKTMDLRAAAEIVHFGFPLGDRTAYRDVSVLHAAEVVRFTTASVTRDRYWRWDHVAPWKRSEAELLDAAYAAFTEAVRRRLHGDRSALAFLSGGLDSRCIVGALRDSGAAVQTFNFSLPGTQDQVLAQAFGQMVGAVHVESPRPLADFERGMRTALDSAGMTANVPPERPALVWSGDGGSVGIGHVYVDPAVVKKLRDGDTTDAMHQYFRSQGMGIPRRLLASRVANVLPGLPELGMTEELAAVDCADPGNAFHLFLMFNDQRRHLASHFEDIDRYRLEYQLPFFDSALLEVVLSAPLEWRMRHRLYVAWLARFPAAVTAVPWQSYPGHVPCPLPVPEGLPHQWDREAMARQFGDLPRARENDLLGAVEMILEAADFPSPLLRKGRLRLAKWIHRLGLRDYLFVFGTARTVFTLWRRCGGSLGRVEEAMGT